MVRKPWEEPQGVFMANADDFKLPRNGQLYVSNIFERYEALIEGTVLGRITKHRLNAWKRNFESPEERYLAACLLDSLIYRSERQTEALAHQLFQRVLPDLARRVALPQGLIKDWRRTLSHDARDRGIRLVPVIDKERHPPTKSSPPISRLIRMNVPVDEKWFIWPGQSVEPVDGCAPLLIFIDDFLGTGDQFGEVYRVITGSNTERPLAIYAPLVAYRKGADDLQRQFPELRIVAAEWLEESHRIFSAESKFFDDGENSPESAEAFYLQFIRSKNWKEGYLRGMPLGFKNCGLSYAFDHGSPDATLPIFWDEQDGFYHLFFRR